MSKDLPYCPYKECPEQYKVHFHNEHQHQHIIPVEWEYVYRTHEKIVGTHCGEVLYGATSDSVPTLRLVTKLRCVCGDEIDRNDTSRGE